MKKVSIIIPSYNEERYIARVLQPAVEAKKEGIVNEIIVVDESTDGTREIIKNFDVTLVVSNKKNGRGTAIKRGLKKSTGDIILLLDADLVGLLVEHINKLVEPLKKNNSVGMTIGIFRSGFISGKATVFTSLNGQRAIRRNLLEAIEDLDDTNYAIDYKLNRFAKKQKVKVKKVKLSHLSYVYKNEKYGIIGGSRRRVKRYGEIFKNILGG